MAKDKLVSEQDKFILRLPNGMRDRIKAAAERHDVSMNEEIINILLRYFPAPATLSDEINELERVLEVLKRGVDVPGVASLRDSVDDLIRGIVKGRIGPVTMEDRQRIAEALEYYDEETVKEGWAQQMPAGQDE